MPCRNIEDRRRYQREWARRKRKNEITRTTPKLNKEEQRQLRLKREAKYRRKKKQIIEGMFGKECFFCGHTKVAIIHNKRGEEHENISNMSIGKLKLINKVEYVRLCGICHKGVHWAMKYLGLKWENFVRK